MLLIAKEALSESWNSKFLSFTFQQINWNNQLCDEFHFL